MNPIALTIAGFDPSSGAGVTADLKTFAGHRVFGVACITALTVQTTQGVMAVEAVPTAILESTLHALSRDMELSAIKVGMLGTAATVSLIAKFLRPHRPPTVLDPVLRSSSDHELLTRDGVEAMRSDLLPVIDWITPNLFELGALIGREVNCRADVPPAAAELQRLSQKAGNWALNIVVTGGHLPEPDDFFLPGGSDGSSEEHKDGLWIEGQRISTSATHGTGCAFSSSIAAQLARGGKDGESIVRSAKIYVTEAMRRAPLIGHGRGPIHHLWPLDPHSS